tara:strand:- start:501 stop:1358 length:858 start_codon:yes stop_codon:yes gene_type:complete
MGQNPMGNFLAASLDPDSSAYVPMAGGNWENIPTYKAKTGSQVVGSNAAKGDAATVVEPLTNVTITSENIGSQSSTDNTTDNIATAIAEGGNSNAFSGFLKSIDETGDSGSKYLMKPITGERAFAAEGSQYIGNQFATIDPGFIADHDQDTFNVIDNDPRMSQEEKDLMKKSIYDANIPKEMEWVAAPGGTQAGYIRAEDWFTLLGMADRGKAAQDQFLSEIPVIYPAEYALMMKQHGKLGSFQKLPNLNYQMNGTGLKTTWLPDRLRAFKANKFDKPEPGFFRS